MKEFLPKSAAKMADCLMKRYGLLTSRWSYDYGVAWRGMEALYAMTGEKKYFDYIKDAMDTFVTDESGAIRDYTLDEFNLDYICNGRQLLYLYKATGDEKYLRAADVLRDQLRRQPRTSDGGFWHKKCYPYQMWLDGLHMSAPFYVEYCLMMEDDAGIRDAGIRDAGIRDAGIRDAAKQLQLAYEHTYEPKTRLNHHGWDESRAQQWSDPETGRSAHAWGRAVGWYMLGLADVLALLPENHECFEPLRALMEKISARMLEIRVDGAWLQVLDCPGREGNYLESSGSCLMTAAILKAAANHQLPDWMLTAAQESFRAIQRHFVGQMRDGTLFLAKTCYGAGLGGKTEAYRDGSYDYYISETVGSYDIKGTGAYIQAACAYEGSEPHA